ncbi:PLP-dependent aminotransferase family protein, partial [Streptomyces violaceusniger]|uniref:aminotransferase-like domain-containing protein n=1 Tax=Streptomyces violaceusniger TaxID=68280 RepID=UPI00380DDFC6
RLLRDDGLLESTRGSGTRVTASGSGVGPAVPASVMPFAKLVDEPPEGSIDLTRSVFPSLDGLPDEALGLTAADIRTLAVNFDYEPLGLPALRTEIAARYARLGLPTATDEVLITTGGQQALNLLFRLFSQDRGTIATENPTYAGALDAARAADATVIGLPSDEEGVTVRSVRDALDRSAVQLMYLMSACHNPTGAVMSAARRHEVAHLAKAAGTPIIDDETLADLTFDDHARIPFAATADTGTVVTVGSLSKLFWAGLRVGWIRAPRQLITRLARLKAVADLGSSHPGQLLAIRMLPRIEEASTARSLQLIKRRDLLADLLHRQLPTWSWLLPQGGPFLWVQLPHSDAEAFARLTLRYGVRVLPGSRTSPDKTFADHLRISFVAEPAEIETAVARLAEAWALFESTGGTDRTLEIVV